MSASETHNRKNLNRSIDDSLQGFPAVAERLRQGGIEVLGAMAVAFGCPFEGDVPLETVLRIARTYAELGVRHITLGDTTGMATPRNIRATLRALRAELPEMEFTLHLHNTRGVGLANVLVGLEEGCGDSIPLPAAWAAAPSPPAPPAISARRTWSICCMKAAWRRVST
ncbi:hypothetical protein ACFQU7_43760 [Pseudoroseomonas wenyumeiae]